MPSKTKTPVAILAIVAHLGNGTTRALHTLEVWPSHDLDERAARAEALRARFAETTGNVVTVYTHAA